MGDARVIERIEAWEAIGLIDHETADRLRSAEAAAPEPEIDRSGRGTAVAAAFFGPAVSVAELFAYIGGGFVLVAWHTIVASYAFRDSASGSFAPVTGILVLEYAGAAILLSILGILAMRGRERQRRFAGVAFGLATWHVFQAVQAGLQPSQSALQGGLNWDPAGALAAVAAVLAALVYRRLHPAVLTQITFLAGLLFLASRLLQVVEGQWYWPLVGNDGTVDPVLARARVGLTIGWWLVCALVFGLLARYERRRAATDSETDARRAARRATVTAWAAGLTAIGGTATAVMQSNGIGRALEPWIGDLAILVVAAVLLALAFRRGAGAYLYPGALGLIVAFTDLNTHYVAERVGTGVAFLVEGAILLGAGLFAERVRRRLAARGRASGSGDDGGGGTGPAETDAPAPEAQGPAPTAALDSPAAADAASPGL